MMPFFRSSRRPRRNRHVPYRRSVQHHGWFITVSFNYFYSSRPFSTPNKYLLKDKKLGVFYGFYVKYYITFRLTRTFIWFKKSSFQILWAKHFWWFSLTFTITAEWIGCCTFTHRNLCFIANTSGVTAERRTGHHELSGVMCYWFS